MFCRVTMIVQIWMRLEMNETTAQQPELSALEALTEEEVRRLSPCAVLSSSGIRRKVEKREGYRQCFAKDADRILHSRAYARYIDKTQVFCLVSNDHITHRVLHVQLVSRIARTIGRFLHLNEDLIEAIALGHDIGHPPFGHAGETFLSELCQENGLTPFQHNIQSVRALDQLERKGQGWNLTVQTLDGILCHDGESHTVSLRPLPQISFASLDEKIRKKSSDPSFNLTPMTFEGCVVRLADTIAYIGRDIEDAIILKLISRFDIPGVCTKVLGNTNGTIVYTLVTDLIRHSRIAPPGEEKERDSSSIGFSQPVAEALKTLKEFNYSHIYLAPATREHLPTIRACYQKLFSFYLDHLNNGKAENLSVDLLSDLEENYISKQSAAARVRDFIAGMTDDFFIKQARLIGCETPPKH